MSTPVPHGSTTLAGDDHHAFPASTASYFPTQPDNLILPVGAISEYTADLLEDMIFPPHDTSTPSREPQLMPHDLRKSKSASSASQRGSKAVGGVGGIGDRGELRETYYKQGLPWWKRPSPWWLLVIVPITAIATSSTIAPRIEVYTMLACSVHKPDIFKETYRLGRPLYDDDILYNSLLVHQVAPSPTAREGFWAGNIMNGTTPNPPGQNLCASDPVVQAEVAKLATIITTLTGLLSCITTSWWGAYSDRRGRMRVIGISVVGLLLADFNFIFTSLCFEKLPGGYWFLLVGPMLDGCLGGITTSVAAMHAYVADTTDEAQRSRTLSLSLGLLFTGMAVGPTIGSLLIRATKNILFVFYAAGLIHLLYAICMRHAKEKFEEEQLVLERERKSNPVGGWFIRLKCLFTFLAPLAVFYPEKKVMPAELSSSRKNSTWRDRDWSLFCLVISYGCISSIVGSYSYNFQYALSTYGWNSETLGYWLSLIGATRAAFLTIILPVSIKAYHWHKQCIANQRVRDSERSPLLTSEVIHPVMGDTPSKAKARRYDSVATASIRSVTSSRSSVAKSPGKHHYYPSETTAIPSSTETTPSSSHIKPPIPDSSPQSQAHPLASPTQDTQEHHKKHHSLQFDLALSRISLIVDFLMYIIMCWGPPSALFTIAGMIGSFGAGFSPAIQSVTLAIYTRKRQREGAFAVRESNAVSSSSLGGQDSQLPASAPTSSSAGNSPLVSNEAGKLFGALSVVQSLTSQILAPTLYGLIYMKTVASYPRMIFYVAAATIVVAFVILLGVSLPETEKPECVGEREDVAGPRHGSAVHEAV